MKPKTKKKSLHLVGSKKHTHCPPKKPMIDCRQVYIGSDSGVEAVIGKYNQVSGRVDSLQVVGCNGKRSKIVGKIETAYKNEQDKDEVKPSTSEINQPFRLPSYAQCSIDEDGREWLQLLQIGPAYTIGEVSKRIGFDNISDKTPDPSSSSSSSASSGWITRSNIEGRQYAMSKSWPTSTSIGDSHQTDKILVGMMVTEWISTATTDTNTAVRSLGIRSVEMDYKSSPAVIVGTLADIPFVVGGVGVSIDSEYDQQEEGKPSLNEQIDVTQEPGLVHETDNHDAAELKKDEQCNCCNPGSCRSAQESTSFTFDSIYVLKIKVILMLVFLFLSLWLAYYVTFRIPKRFVRMYQRENEMKGKIIAD